MGVMVARRAATLNLHGVRSFNLLSEHAGEWLQELYPYFSICFCFDACISSLILFARTSGGCLTFALYKEFLEERVVDEQYHCHHTVITVARRDVSMRRYLRGAELEARNDPEGKLSGVI